MTRIAGTIKTIYNFFAGDAILLGAVILAFVAATLLGRAAHMPNALVAVLFVALIVGGLVATLDRERRGHRR